MAFFENEDPSFGKEVGDRAGLISFADDVRTEFPLSEVGDGMHSAQRKPMIAKVAGMRTRGMTAFYAAVKTGALTLSAQLKTEPYTPKWLVALTDGADMDSKSKLEDAVGQSKQSLISMFEQVTSPSSVM